jgi:hypothetical protein
VHIITLSLEFVAVTLEIWNSDRAPLESAICAAGSDAGSSIEMHVRTTRRTAEAA